jgi:hypothetical protein
MLNRGLEKSKIPRSSVKIGNIINCQPPGNKIEKTTWEYTAPATCRERYLAGQIDKWVAAGGRVIDVGTGPSLADDGTWIPGRDPTFGPVTNKVMVTLGAVPLRNILGLPKRGVRVQDFHGTIQRDPSNRFWVVPSYHPSHLARGAFNLFGVMRFDFERAKHVAEHGWEVEDTELVEDPDVWWFREWAEVYLAAVAEDPWGIWLAVDIETPDKAKKVDEGELKIADRDYQITRVNFSYNRNQGVTVPFHGPYIEIIKRLLEALGVKCFWNANYDVPRLRSKGIAVAQPIWDFMWAWHVLQSDLPRGLGFVAPFYSTYGPWKHLSDTEPVKYAAIDGVQTLRVAFGITEHLQRLNMWHVFERHVWKLDTLALHPAEEVGLLADKDRLLDAHDELAKLQAGYDEEIRALVPDTLRPLIPINGTAKPPKKLKEGEELVEQDIELMVTVCRGCGAEGVHKKHRCKSYWVHVEGERCSGRKDCGIKGKGSHVKVAPAPDLSEDWRVVHRFFRRRPFNPGSRDMLLTYIYAQGDQPGHDKKDGHVTVNKETLERLARKGDKPIYGKILLRRRVSKVDSTYILGSLKRLDNDPRSKLDGRLHPTFLHKPSTQRLSCQDPNLQNVVHDDDGPAGLFRPCIIAQEDCVLLEVDFAGIEAVLTGWFSRDPNYIRLAKLGVHAYITSVLVGESVDLNQPDHIVYKQLKAIKARFPHEYDQCKRFNHGFNYGLTIRGMVLQFPKEFPTLKEAERVQEVAYRVAPKLPTWQAQVRERAAKDSYLGGKEHPFGYMHWFFNVLNYRPLNGKPKPGRQYVSFGNRVWEVKLGEDAKRVVAFYPQSTAAGVIAEVMLRLFDPEHESYIGDRFYGRTPLRAQIHDALLLEVPLAEFDYVYERVVREMRRPIKQLWCPKEWGVGTPMPEDPDGEHYLSIGTEAKIGYNWGKYHAEEPCKEGCKHRWNVDGMRVYEGGMLPSDLASDIVIPQDDYDEELEEQVTPDRIAVM